MAEDNRSAVDKFLGELGTEGDKDPLDKTPEDPFAKSSAEEIEETVEEKPIPFHKDPKVQKFIDKQVEKRIEQLERSSPPVREDTTGGDDETKEILTELIGNDTPEKLAMIRKFGNVLSNLKGEAKMEALQEIESRQAEEREADRDAEIELEDAFENIEETFDVDITSNNAIARKTRQEFVSFVERIAPKDRDGEIVDYPDMIQAYETFDAMKKSSATPSRAKELASRGLARSSSADTKPDISHLTFDNVLEHITGK